MRAAENRCNPGGEIFCGKSGMPENLCLKCNGGNAPEDKAAVSERHIFLTTESARAESAASAQSSD